MNLYGTIQELEQELDKLFPGAKKAIGRSKYIPAQMLPYQAMALFGLAQSFNNEDSYILEIGTAAGFSASIIAQAAPKAKIVTLNCAHNEIEIGQKNLARWNNVTVTEMVSWNYLAHYIGPYLDMIFVDGDHKRVGHDMLWFNWLKIGGLMLFHDYSILTSGVVYETVNIFAGNLKRMLDVVIVDTDKVGIAGLYRQKGDYYK